MIRALSNGGRPWPCPAVVLTGAVLALAGCAAVPPPPPQRTTVILLPDDDGRVGAVTLSNAAGTQALDKAYGALVAQQGAAGPATFESRSVQLVEQGYAELLRAQPPKPASFTLNFVLDSAALTAESAALLKSVIAAALARKPTEIMVFGHADESGPPERNLRLSAERAQSVADILRESDPNLGTIDVQHFGDRVPLVPTAGRKAEPRNRRVEITIL